MDGTTLTGAIDEPLVSVCAWVKPCFRISQRGVLGDMRLRTRVSQRGEELRNMRHCVRVSQRAGLARQVVDTRHCARVRQ